MLHDDRHVALEDARVVGRARDRLGIVEVVEAEVRGAADPDTLATLAWVEKVDRKR